MSYDLAVGLLNEEGEAEESLPTPAVRAALERIAAVVPNGSQGYVCCWNVRTGAPFDPKGLPTTGALPEDVGWIEIDLEEGESESETPVISFHVPYQGLERSAGRLLEVGFGLAGALKASVYDPQKGSVLVDADRKGLEASIVRMGVSVMRQVEGHLTSEKGGQEVSSGLDRERGSSSRLPWMWILWAALLFVWVAIKIFYR